MQIARRFLQRKVLLIVFIKIQRFCFRRDPLIGIIRELPALAVQRNNAFFNAENLLIIQFGAVSTISAGFYNLFPKQQSISLISMLSS